MKRPWLEANGNTFPYRKLIHVASLKARIGWQSLRTGEFVDEGPYCVTGTDFQNGKVNWSTAYHVSTERYEMDRNIQLDEGDLLVTKDGTIGKVAVVQGLDAPATLNSGVFVVRPKTNELSADFLGWVIRSKVFDDFVAFNFSGSTINHLYQNVFETFRFPFPDLATQLQIADFLDRETARIDLLIEKKQRLVALLGEQWEAKIQSEVSGVKATEKELNDNPFCPAVPHGWRMQSLKSIFNLVSGYAFKSEFFRKGETNLPILVTPGSFNPSGGLYPTRDVDVGYCGDFDKRFALKAGDMVVAMTDLSYRKLILGRCEVVDREGMLLNQRIAKIINLLSDVRSEFLRYAMNARSSREQVSLSAVGATVFHSSSDKIRSTHILVPPLRVQKRIVDELDQHDRLNRDLTKGIVASIDRLKEYRSALITAAVTGQIDVETYAKSGTPDCRLDAIQEEMGA